MIESGDTFIDVGAGDYGTANYVKTLMDKIGNAGKIYAFDPFTLNLPDKPNIFKIRKAVWEYSGIIDINIIFPLGIQRAMSAGETPQAEENYEATSLDDFFPTEKIDLIKVDVEGAELKVLFGAKKVLNRNFNIKIILECHPFLLPSFNDSLEKIWNYITELGFNVFNENLIQITKEKFIQGESHEVFLVFLWRHD